MPEASDRKRKVRPGHRGVDAYGRMVVGTLGREDGYVENFEDEEVAGMGGTEMEAAWLKWGCNKSRQAVFCPRAFGLLFVRGEVSARDYVQECVRLNPKTGY